jgi:hypothetical protein
MCGRIWVVAGVQGTRVESKRAVDIFDCHRPSIKSLLIAISNRNTVEVKGLCRYKLPALEPVFLGLDEKREEPVLYITGIGLAMCQRTLEQYGGRIWVGPHRVTGSTFYFTAPRPTRPPFCP